MRISRILTALAVLLVGLGGLAAPAHGAPTLADPIGGGSPLTINGGRCTAGFAATDPGGSRWYLITGGDCGSAGGSAYSNGKYVGPVVGHSFPQNSHALVEVVNRTDWVLVPWIDTGGGQVTLTGSTEAPVGSSVCKAGMTSGWHCGAIVAKNQTVNYPWGTVTGLTRTTVCSEPGDNGAPFVSGNQAQGILFGASGSCGSGGTSYFQPINEILALYGLILFTG